MRVVVCNALGSRHVVAMTLALAVATALVSAQIPGRNVNMVSGARWPDGDTFLQRQNEPSLAASTRNPLHLLAGANDYRTVDLPGLPGGGETGDAWLGVFKSLDGGNRWTSTLLPGYPQDTSPVGRRSPLRGFEAGADPVVRPGTNGLFYYSGIVFDRGEGGKSQVFVARFIDNNNKEAGDPIQYVSASVVARDTGKTGALIDKPWIAVDVPRAGAVTCRIDAPGTKGRAQLIRAGTVYLAYSVISGEGANITGTIMFSRSIDCGVTWSHPVAISRPADKVNQGATIAVDPVTGVVHVAWRKFSVNGGLDGIVATRAQPGATRFEKPAMLREFYAGRELGQLIRFLVGSRKKRAAAVEPPGTPDPVIAPFDQGTLGDRFRTNAYPTMAIDGQSRVYLAWSERGYRQPNSGPTAQDDASIVMTTGVQGANWTTPSAVDLHDDPGHQFMPSLAFGGGKLMLVYYDLREDVSGFFNSWIDETSAIGATRKRHTIDLRAAQADPGAVPAFTSSVRVSEYLQGSRRNSRVIEQLQFNPPNLPLFQLGEVPFMGDYIDIAPAPAMVQDAAGQWRHNTAASGAPVFHTAWTDNRDVRPPPDGDWTRYTPPTGTPLTSTFDPAKTVEPCSPGRAGMRNQNVYTARITAGLLAGSPGNAKPLHPDLPRAFVVFAQNTTTFPKAFRLTITGQPVGGRASFTQLESQGIVPYIDVLVPARATISKSVFATSSDPHAKIPVAVEEISALGATAPLPEGLSSIVLLNPDIANPDIANPDIANPDIANPDIANAEVYNPDIANPDIANPDIANPDIANPDIANPDIANVVIVNPDIANPDIANPDIANPDIANPDIANPDIANPDIANGSLTDITWTVTNKGNTTASYDINLLAADSIPSGIKAQLIIHRTHKTPVSDGCTLKTQTQTILVANVILDPANPDIANPSLWLEPGGTGKVTLRIMDPDPRDDVTFNPVAGGTAVTPEVQANAINTTQLSEPDPEPPTATPPSVTSTSLSVLAQPQAGLVSVPLGLFRVQVLRTVDGATSPLAGASVAASLVVNPSGGQLAGQSTVLTDAAGYADFTTMAVDRVGQGYQVGFTAAAAGAVPVASAPFTVTVPDADPTQNVFVVTSTADSGTGTLRKAIEDANATPNGAGGPDVITFGFRLPAVYTIALATPLPSITQPVIIDGATQAGYNPTTGQPLIHVVGTGANNFQGLVFSGGAANSRIRGVSLTGFGTPTVLDTTAAIHVMASSVTIDGNWIGIAPDGTPAGNKVGVWISSGSALLGGTNGVATRNIISAGQQGIYASGGTGTTVRGNFIGTSPDGLTARPNTDAGINLQPGATGTIVGGPVAVSGSFAAGSPANLISANLGGGLSLQDSGTGGPANTQILGNVIGLAANGTDLGNGGYGILLQSASGAKVGAPGAGNVISGNGSLAPAFIQGPGIIVANGSSGAPAVAPVVQSNFIGVDPTGTIARPNTLEGIWLFAAAEIGGTDANEGNLIAGNGDSLSGGTGMIVAGAAGGSTIQGNIIGLSANGLPFGNTYSGITLTGVTGSVLIGGSVPGARNVISGNPVMGIVIYPPSPQTDDVVIQGNYIGTDVSGAVAGVGNGHAGVVVWGGTGHIIGGATAAHGNVIAGNGIVSPGAGVRVEGSDTRRVTIKSNSIFGNNGLGIDIDDFGILANDNGDADAGTNDRQNHPVVSAAVNAFNSEGYIDVTLNSIPGTYTIQVFKNDACSPSGYGEGQTLIAETTVIPSGLATTGSALIVTPLVAGQRLSATATDSQGNTSEFSPCTTVTTTNAFYWSANGHFYEYVNTPTASWNAADAAANARSFFGRSGHLVAITTNAENGFVQSLYGMMGLGDMRAWIGLIDPGGTGAWEWVTGEAYVSADAHWAPGEPNFIGSERWVEFFAAGTWNNNFETYGPNQGFVVEYQFPLSF